MSKYYTPDTFLNINSISSKQTCIPINKQLGLTTIDTNKSMDTCSKSTNSIQSSKMDEKHDKTSLIDLLDKHKIVCVLCLLVAFGGFVFGWDTGTISGFVQMSNFKQMFGEFNSSIEEYEFSNTRVGLIISIFNLGCAIGGITLGKLGDIFGRKSALIIAMLVYIVGIAVQISSFHWIQFMIGRIVSGFAVGTVSVLSPMFIAETSPSEIRGIMVSCYQLMITLGILLGYITTFGTVHSFVDTRQWKIPLGLCFAWALFMIGGMLFLPESPRFLIEKGKDEEAKNSIAKVNGLEPESYIVLKEMKEITAAITEEKEAGEVSWKELISGKPHLFTRLIIGIALQSFQQLTGNNYFFYYGTSIFKSVGLQDSFLTSIILGAVNFGSTFVALYSISRVGRRTNLVFGSLAMAACLVVFSAIGTTILYPNGPDMPTDKQAGYTMIALTCVFIFMFAVTWAPGVFVVVSETYPLRIRSKGMALATAANWIWGFLIAFFTPIITSYIKFAYGFVFFGCTVAAFFFVWFMVPETENLTLEQIEKLYMNYKPFEAAITRYDFDKAIKFEREHSIIAKHDIPKPTPDYGFKSFF
jgi:SP family sugar:H+ symporter-like MFS transporter